MRAEDLVSKGLGLKVWTHDECVARCYKSINASETEQEFWQKVYEWAYFRRDEKPEESKWIHDCVATLAVTWEQVNGRRLAHYVEIKYSWNNDAE